MYWALKTSMLKTQRVSIRWLRSKLAYDHNCKIRIRSNADIGYLLNILQ